MTPIDLPPSALKLTVGKQPVHTVHISCAHPLANAAKDIFEMAEGLGEGLCLVLDRQARGLCVAQLEQARLLDAQEFIVIERARGLGRGDDLAGKQQDAPE
jgi:hypothetical protein